MPDDPTKAFDDSSGGGGSTTADQEEDDDPFGSGFELDDDDTITSDGDPVEPDDDTDDQRRDDDDDDDEGGATGADAADDTGGTEESAPGEGDEVDATAGTDPDAGDDSTRTLRDDAESDPFSEPTERVDRGATGVGNDDPFGRGFELEDDNTITSDGEPVERDDDRRPVPGPVGTGRGDQPSDVSEEDVQEVSEREIRDSLREQYPNADEIDVQRLDEDTYAVDVRYDDDYYDRSGVVQVDEEQVSGRLMAEEARIEEETGRDVAFDVSPEGNIEVVDRGERFETASDIGPERDDVLEAIDREVETAVGRQRARRLGFGTLFAAPAGTAGTSEGGLRLEDELAREFADLERGEDYTVDVRRTGEGIEAEAELTESFRQEEARRLAATEIERRTTVPIDAEEDIEIGESGRAQLTPDARERVIERQTARRQQEEYGDIRIEDAGDLPLVGGLFEAAATTAGVEPPGVSDLPRRVRLETETFDAERARPGPSGTVERQRGRIRLDTFEEGTSLEEALSMTGRRYSEFAGDVAEANVEYNPFAQAAVDVGGELGYGEETETAIRSAVRAGVEFGNVPSLALTVKEAGEFAGYAGEEIIQGRGGVSVVEGDEPYRVTPLRVEETGLAPEVAADAEDLVRESIEYARENPAEVGGAVVGSLALSAGVMGGAAAISRRAGLASRVLIQPGEEALGYGGYYATRAVSGTRTAERLFPAKEPLIFSEEAAIRAARRGGARARRLGGRLRSELGRTELDVTPRAGLGAGGLSIEIERGELEEPGQIDADDIAEPLGRPRPGRLADPSRTDLTGYERRRRRRRLYEEIERPPDVVERGIIERRQRRIAEAERERGREVSQRRIESALGIEPLAMEGLGIGGRSAVEPMSEVATMSEADVRAKQDPLIDVELDQEVNTEMEFEPLLELETETEFEPISELELETEFELETELEAEIEPQEEPPDLPDRRRRRRRPGWVRRIERDLINPFTGQ